MQHSLAWLIKPAATSNTGEPMDETTTSVSVIANGKEVPTQLPCTLEQFLVAQKLLPRSVVVEHNGEAVAPSEFAKRQLRENDRLEIVRIVAGG